MSSAAIMQTLPATRYRPQSVRHVKYSRADLQQKPLPQIHAHELESHSHVDPIPQFTAQDVERLLHQPRLLHMLNKYIQQQEFNAQVSNDPEDFQSVYSALLQSPSPVLAGMKAFEAKRPRMARNPSSNSSNNSSASSSATSRRSKREGRALLSPPCDSGYSSTSNSPKKRVETLLPSAVEPNHLELARNAREATEEELAVSESESAFVIQLDLTGEVDRLNEETQNLHRELELLRRRFSAIRVENESRQKEVQSQAQPNKLAVATTPTAARSPSRTHPSMRTRAATTTDVPKLAPRPQAPLRLQTSMPAFASSSSSYVDVPSPLRFMRPREAPSHLPAVEEKENCEVPQPKSSVRGRRRKAVLKLITDTAGRVATTTSKTPYGVINMPRQFD